MNNIYNENNKFDINPYLINEGKRVKNLIKSGASLDKLVSSIQSISHESEWSHREIDDTIIVRKIYLITKAVQAANELSVNKSVLNVIHEYCFGSPIDRAQKIIAQLKEELANEWKDALRVAHPKPTLSQIDCLIDTELLKAEQIVENRDDFGRKLMQPVTLVKLQNASLLLKNVKILIKLFGDHSLNKAHLNERYHNIQAANKSAMAHLLMMEQHSASFRERTAALTIF